MVVTIKDDIKTMLGEQGFGGNKYPTKITIKAISKSESLFEILVRGGSILNSKTVE